MRRVLFLLLSGLSIACTAPGLVVAQAQGVTRPSPRDPYGEHIAEAAQRFGLPEAWIRAVASVESGGDPRADG